MSESVIVSVGCKPETGPASDEMDDNCVSDFEMTSFQLDTVSIGSHRFEAEALIGAWVV